MPFSVQVTIDCADPHALADWWAETLEWRVEAQDADVIRAVVAQGDAREDQTTVHNGALVWRDGAAIVSGDPAMPRILFQRVPEAKTVKNRVHLDIRTGGLDEEVRARLLARGATVLWTGSQGAQSWVTMADPEGNEFCV